MGGGWNKGPLIDHVCRQCGKHFGVRPCVDKIGQGIFCSRECKDKSKQVRVKMTCQKCGKEFETIPAEVKKGRKFCSKECEIGRRVVPGLEKPCELCGKTFRPRPSSLLVGKGRFCSEECMRIARRFKVKETCQVCGKEFEVTQSRHDKGNAKYCSWPCKIKAQSGDKPEARLGENRKCETCGKEFYAERLRINKGWSRFCSWGCHDVFQRRHRVVSHCKTCGKEMILKPFDIKNNHKLFCSHACFGKATRSEFYVADHRGVPLTSRWRKAVLERDGYRCCACGDGARIGHHVRSWKENPDSRWDLGNGVSLCKKCHLLLHSKREITGTTEYIQKLTSLRNLAKYKRFNCEPNHNDLVEQIKVVGVA